MGDENSNNPHVQTLSVSDVSKRSGVPISTIHLYEEKGLIKSWRNSSNHRRFSVNGSAIYCDSSSSVINRDHS